MLLESDDASLLAGALTFLESALSARASAVGDGWGGRAITKNRLRNRFDKALKDELEALTFPDLNHDVVNRELAHEKQVRRSGPSAENILRDIGTVAATIR